MTPTLILRNGILNDVQHDIAIEGDTIIAIEPHLELTAPTEIDVAGNLVSPPFVESHIHLDSALTAGQPRYNQSGTLFEGIEIWRDQALLQVRCRLPQKSRKRNQFLAHLGKCWVC